MSKVRIFNVCVASTRTNHNGDTNTYFANVGKAFLSKRDGKTDMFTIRLCAPVVTSDFVCFEAEEQKRTSDDHANNAPDDEVPF